MNYGTSQKGKWWGYCKYQLNITELEKLKKNTYRLSFLKIVLNHKLELRLLFIFINCPALLETILIM